MNTKTATQFTNPILTIIVTLIPKVRRRSPPQASPIFQYLGADLEI
ncbi:MAG: hypothetical protein V7K38_02540 [Nostoc sp.]